MIQIKKNEGAESERDRQLLVDGVRVESGYAFASISDEKGVYASLYESDDSQRLAAHSFAELPQELQEVKLTLDLDWPETVHQAEIRRRRKDKTAFEIGYKFEFSYEDWKGLYSFAEYAEAFKEALNQSKAHDIEWQADEVLANGFELWFPSRSNEASIIEEISRSSTVLSQLADVASTLLKAEVEEGSLVVSFDFPPQVKVPCEQYLLYFIQFLQDLGVDATSHLEDQAGRVLFSVTPSNEKDALDKIRDALDMYLRFPSSPISNSDSQPIAIQRLESNILHLRGALKLAAAELQAKDATIQTQQLTIDIQKRLLSGEILMDSMKNVTPKAEDKEPLLGGVVALATFKGKGLEVNLGELFRKLKKKFSKDDVQR